MSHAALLGLPGAMLVKDGTLLALWVTNRPQHIEFAKVHPLAHCTYLSLSQCSNPHQSLHPAYPFIDHTVCITAIENVSGGLCALARL